MRSKLSTPQLMSKALGVLAHMANCGTITPLYITCDQAIELILNFNDGPMKTAFENLNAAQRNQWRWAWHTYQWKLTL